MLYSTLMIVIIMFVTVTLLCDGGSGGGDIDMVQYDIHVQTSQVTSKSFEKLDIALLQKKRVKSF